MRFSDGTEILGPECESYISVDVTPLERIDWLDRAIKSEQEHVDRCTCDRCDAEEFIKGLKQERKTIAKAIKL